MLQSFWSMACPSAFFTVVLVPSHQQWAWFCLGLWICVSCPQVRLLPTPPLIPSGSIPSPDCAPYTQPFPHLQPLVKMHFTLFPGAFLAVETEDGIHGHLRGGGSEAVFFLQWAQIKGNTYSSGATEGLVEGWPNEIHIIWSELQLRCSDVLALFTLGCRCRRGSWGPW